MTVEMDELGFYREVWRDICPHMVNHATSFIVRKGSGRYDLASGSLVRIRDRWFIATARHTIPSNPNDGNVFLLAEHRRYPNVDGVLEFRKRGVLKWPDVGYLELNPNVARSYLRQDPCPVERLQPSWDYTGERSVALVGCSRDDTDFFRRPDRHGVEASMRPLFTYPIVPSQWPKPPDGDPATELENDIFLDFTAKTAEDLADRRQWEMCSLEGYSGGGIWDVGLSPDGVWSTDEIRLVGIQSRWHPDRRYARGVQILHWLRLVHRDYPDLREYLEECFPALRGVL